METFIPALIVSFREGLEAFLIIAILLQFLDKTNNKNFKKNVWQGASIGIFVSLIFGIVLTKISSLIEKSETTTGIWESASSFIAVILITTFIILIIKHGDKIKDHVENKAALNLSIKGIFLLALFMVAREGVEIAIFSFTGKYSITPIILGLILSIGLVMLIYHSLLKIKLKTIFTITLAYLILQVGFLMGYSIHEGLSVSAELGIIAETNPVLNKAFDLSQTVLNHKTGVIGVPLYVALGWHSKPEWIQFIAQYSYTILFFVYWYRKKQIITNKKL